MTTDAEKKLVLGLTSGKQLSVSRVLLFPEPVIQQVLLLRAKAQEELGGFTTGLGFWGSPGWVIGGAAALGFVESLISNSKTKKGLELLKEAAQKYEQLNGKGSFFAIGSIEGISQPNPATWHATQVAEFQIDLNPMGLIEKGQTIQRYDITRKQIENGVATVTGPIGFVHNEDEFVLVEVDAQPIAVRWSSVESYQLA